MGRWKRSAPDCRGGRSRARVHRTGIQRNHTAARMASQSSRAAFHWLLDAATFARDGDARNARRAAQQGMRALFRGSR